MTRQELKDKINETKLELERLERELNQLDGITDPIRIEIETDDHYNPDKLGHAYLAVVTITDTKINREFVNWTNRIWDSKHKTYKANWITYLPVDTKLEGRLGLGKKDEIKTYFIVTEEGYEERPRQEILGL